MSALHPLSAPAVPPSAPPNIVYVLADDLGYGDVSCLNPESKIRTPNLDRLAAEGMAFTDAHANSAVCTPTRYGVMTGRYAWRSHLRKGVLWGFSPPLIPSGRMTVASLLKSRGYDTAMIGKWHLGMDWPLLEQPTAGWETFHDPRVDWTRPIRNGPTTLGFDSFFGISASLDMPPYCYIADDRTVGIPSVKKNFFRNRVGPATPEFEADGVLAEFGRRACDYVARKAEEKRPFFLYLPLNSPHTPIAPRKEFQGRSGINAYADFVIETDAVMGELLASIDRAGIRDNTLVIFTSDNGCSPEANFEELAKAGHHPSHVFRGAKADLFEGGHRVPFIARWPARVKAGQSQSDTVCLTDLMATVADITGASIPSEAGEDSVSLMPALLDAPGRPERPPVVHQSIDGSLSIREGKWKLLFTPGSGGWSPPKEEEARNLGLPEIQLFDLTADVAEARNVQADHPEITKRLTATLESLIARGRSTPGPDQPNDVPVPLVVKRP